MMSKQGFVFRMEPDGTSFESDLHKLVTKAWSDEAHSESRISREGNQYTNAAIIDLVYTQPIFYYEFTHNRKICESGLLPRTLCYFTNIRDDKNDLTPKKGIDKDCLNFTKNLFKEIYSNAFGAKENIDIYLYNNVSEILNEFINKTKNYIEDGLCDEIKGWASRAAQHAVKLAGIIYILESEPMIRPYITAEYMITAINIVKILMNNLDQYIRGFPDDKLKEITYNVGINILEQNLGLFNETDFKQTIKSKYNAKEVDAALRELEFRGIISRYDDRPTREKRRGRPSGTIYINNYPSLLAGLNLELPYDF